MPTAIRQPRPLSMSQSSALHFLSLSQRCPEEQSPCESHECPRHVVAHCLSLEPQQYSSDAQCESLVHKSP